MIHQIYDNAFGETVLLPLYYGACDRKLTWVQDFNRKTNLNSGARLYGSDTSNRLLIRQVTQEHMRTNAAKHSDIVAYGIYCGPIGLAGNIVVLNVRPLILR